jgi:hypothetical protein
MTSRAPVVFTEPRYQEEYHDVDMPLNDFIEGFSSPYLADNAQLPSPDLSPVPQAFTPIPHSISPQKISSPLFISDIYPVPQLSLNISTSSANLFSSDDTMIHTPTHDSTGSPERDGIQDVLRNRHPFIASVYATSPSLGRLPLNALVGEYDYSPQRQRYFGSQTSSPLLGPTWVCFQC